MGTFRTIDRRRIRASWLFASLLAVMASSMTTATAWSQGADVVDNGLSTPGTSTPITITSDHAATWIEKNDRVFLLQGKIRIEQGGTVITMNRGAVWVDLQRKAATGGYYLHIYGEDGVQLESSGQKRQGPRGMFALATTGAISVDPTASKLVEQNLTTDAAYTRAFEERQRIGAAAAQNARPNVAPSESPIVQVQATDPLAPGSPTPPPPPPPFTEVPPPPAPGVSGPTTPSVPGTAPSPVPPPPFFGPGVPPPAVAPAPPGTPRQFSIRPRTSEEIKVRNYTMPNGETVYVVPSPIILTITNPKDKIGVLDIEADRLVFWTRGDGKQLFESMRGPQGKTTQHIEFYLAGNVEMRSRTAKEEEILRADEVYYDVSRSVAIATQGNLEIRQPKLPQPIHVKADEIHQLNSKTFQAINAQVYSTILPSDPGLRVTVKTATIEERQIQRKTIFGTPIYDRETGQPKVDTQRYFDGRSVLFYAEQVPVFYLPFLRGDVEDPLGPLDSISVGGSQIFGFTFQSTWDIYQLFGLERPEGQRWRLYLDYMSERGPAIGTEYTAMGRDLFSIPNRYDGFLKAYGIYDTGEDVLGGDRGIFYFPPPPGTMIPYSHPDWRGRVLSRWNIQDLPDGFTVQGQLGLISDQNFIEQYYLNEWLTDYNQETYAYVKQQQNQWAWSIVAQPRLRGWITDPQWLPRADGWLLGQKLANDWLTLDVHGSAAYSMMRTPDVPSFSYAPTDVNVDTGRFDLWSELAMPLNAGAFKFTPYVVGDAAYYTQDVNGDGLGRLFGGGGARASIPFSRLYPDIRSDFWNVDSIYHKVNLNTNYLYARSTDRYTSYPQLDRLNDDTTDQALRDLQQRQIFINPSNAAFLTTSPLIDPQSYAIRRLIDSRIDTIDQINVFQFNVENRWQTLRGIAASEHVIDWMTLNLGASLFPQNNRDNYGQAWGILEYDWLWNIGDRTALVSNGWMEPVAGGPRVFNFGGILNRPGGTNFYLGYRQIDPLQSKAVVANFDYTFSQKYGIYASTVWDFGVDQQTYAFGITRTGTDFLFSLGLAYNSVVENFSVQFMIVPNLVRSQLRSGAGMGNNYSLVGR